MLSYTIRKLLHTSFVALGVVTLAFGALRLSGDPAATMLPGDATVEELQELFHEVHIYGTSKRVVFKPRPDYRLIVSEMTLTP